MLDAKRGRGEGETRSIFVFDDVEGTGIGAGRVRKDLIALFDRYFKSSPELNQYEESAERELTLESWLLLPDGVVAVSLCSHIPVS
jgi:hypothetical protein